MGKMLSIQKKFRNILMSIIVMLFISIGLLFYIFVTREIDEKYISIANDGIDRTGAMLSDIIEDAQQGLHLIDAYSTTEKELSHLLNIVYQTTSEVSTVYIGMEDDTFENYPSRNMPAGYKPTVRDWYKAAMKNTAETVWSEPYIDAGTKQLTITGSREIIDSNGGQGVVGIDILLNDLSKIVDDVTIGENGYLMLLSADGKIIAHPAYDYLGTAFDAYAPIKTPFKDLLRENEEKDYIVLTEDSEFSGLKIVAVISKADILNDLSAIVYMASGIFVIFLIVSVIVSNFFSQKLTRPIIELVNATEEVEKGNYEIQCYSESRDEIGRLVVGFNNMLNSIRNNHVEMQALNEQLTASEEILKSQYDALLENNAFIKKSENRYKFIFEASKEGLWDTDEGYNFYYLTPNWYRTFGIDTEASSYEEWKNRIHPDDQMTEQHAIEKHLLEKTDHFKCEYRVKDSQGQYRWIEVIGKSRHDDDGIFLGLTGSHLDITMRKEYELRILDMAYKDDLTQLYNRTYFQQYLTQYLQENRKGALVFTDIDNFKHINDIYGHSFGDEVLKQLAGRLAQLFSDEKKYVLARFSGDEFILLIKDIDDKPTIEFIMHALCKEIKSTIYYGNKFFQVSASTGVTLFPSDGRDMQTLLQNADIAMYYAKRISKKDFYFYDNEIKSKAVLEIQLENNLKSAIENKEIKVHYQPIVSSDKGAVSSFEALVRWQMQDGSWIYPDVFIPIAEKTGLINEIGIIVFDKACAFLSKMNQRGTGAYKVAINISVVQLMEEHFANKIMAITKEHGLANDQIILEITESMTLEANENIIAKLYYLRNHKFGIALDDFGTGYSSFRNLIGLPLSSIKMDRSIVQESIYNENVNKLLTSIVDFAHKSNIEVVAEGIEDATYYKTAASMKADFMQGYFFGKPVSEMDIEALIESIDEKKVDLNG